MASGGVMDDSSRGKEALLYNSRIFRNYIRLISSRYKHIDLDELLRYAGMESFQVEDDGHWFTQEQTNRFHEKVSSLTHENIAREAGSYTSSPDSLGPMRQYFISLMGLAAVYDHMGKWSKKFSRSSTYTTRRLAKNKVEITVTPNPGVQEEPFQCENRLGYLEGFSRLFNVLPPEVEHPECLFRNGSACRYIVSWQESLSGRLFIGRNILYLVLMVGCILSIPTLSFQASLVFFLPVSLIVALGAGWYADRSKIQELQRAMAEISASSDEQMEQISANYDNSLLINEVGQALNKQQAIKGVLQAITDIMQKRLLYDRGLILMANRNKTKLVFHCGYGFTKQQEGFLHQADFRLNDPSIKSIFSQAFVEKKPRSVKDVAELETEPSSQNYEYANRMKSRTIISCPILYENEPLGVLAVDSIGRKKRLFQRDINLLMGIATQIGARVHNIMLHDRLRQTQKMEAVGSLAGGVAHDFNNILTTILGYSELTLLRLPENDPLQENIEAIHAAGERASRLTRQLLAFSRNQVLEMKVYNLNDIVVDISKMLRRLIGDNVEMKLELSDSLGNILADPSQIEQILLNLAVNARDAMPLGGNLVIATRQVELTEAEELQEKYIPAGPYVILSVSDTGEGMQESIRERVFEPFFTTKPVDKGTGLGLSTVYGIVKQHKGYINIFSEAGMGTIFTVYFPVVDAEAQKKTPKEKLQPVEGSATILAVDDDPAIRKLVLDTLEPLGYTIFVAANGKEALEISRLKKEKIDLLLTDVVMPGMNGRQLLGKLLADRPALKAILMSGYPADIVSPNSLLGTDFVFLSKPFAPTALTQKIKQVLDA